jgi:hypothetical protein
MAAAQLAGEDFLAGLDRLRADAAGQQVTPVPGLASSTATGLARRFTAKHWRGAEAGLAAATSVHAIGDGRVPIGRPRAVWRGRRQTLGHLACRDRSFR